MLSKTCIERLATLADYMDGLHTPDFTMEKITHKCGTPACAIGHGLALPALNKVGLNFPVDALKVFDIDMDKWKELFSASLGSRIKTPQQWAAHCRKWLAEHGAVLPTKQAEISTQKIDGDFLRFLDRLYEPLPDKMKGTT